MKSGLLFVALFASIFSFGQSFLPQNSGVTSQLNAISFASSTTGVVVGNGGVIRRTTDAGLHWTGAISGTTADLTDVTFVGPNTYIAVGKAGTLLKSTNAGGSWVAMNAGTSADLLGIYSNGMIVFITGANGTVIKSTNYGSAWSLLSTGVSLDLNDAYFTTDVIGYVVGESGTVLKTVNGGGAWTFLDVGTTAYELTSVIFPDGMHGVITGANSGTNQSVIFYSDDAGTTWDSENFPGVYLSEMSFADFSLGYLVGGSITGNTASVYSSTSYGTTWTAETATSSRQLGVCAPSFNVVYTCGTNGTILRRAENTAGIEEETTAAVQVSPNPSAGIFNVQSDNANPLFSIEVYSVDGLLLFTSQATTIDLSEFPSGVYLAVINTTLAKITSRLVKE